MTKLKLLCLAIVLLCLASAAWAQTPQLVVFNGYVAPAGYPFGPATIAVCTVGGSGGPPCSPLTIIYTDASGTKQKPNPFTIDPQGNGNFNFFANCGTQYALQSYGNGYTTTLTTITTSVCTGGGGGNPVGPASGDLNGSYPGPGVVRINGGSLPTSKPYVGTNASGQLIDATPPLSKPLIGTNASGQIVDATPPLSKNIIGTNGTGNIIDATTLTLSNPLSVIHNPASVTITGATPSVSGGNIFATNNGSATTITNFTGGVDSQTITVNCGDANTTIANGTNIATFAGGNLVCIANQAYSFTFYSSLSKWVQVGGGGNPGGIPVQSQFNSNNTFAGSSCVNLPTISSTSVNFDCDTHFVGLNPWIDATRFHVRACVAAQAPCQTGITATLTSGNQVVPISTNTCSAQTQVGGVCFVVGDGVVIQQGGPANTMATPGAPTVTPSIANVLTGTRMVSPGPTGATTYNYQIFAEDEGGGLTPVSATGTTTTGAATLGTNIVNVSNCVRTNNSTTCTTSASHGYQIGTNPQIIYLQNMQDSSFDGWFTTSNVADSTHFTFISSQDSRTGASANSGTGTATWWNCNHLTWASVTGAYRYWIVGRVSGSFAILGYSWPVGLFSAGGFITEGVTSWDDFGSTMMGNLILPWYMSATPPAAATHDNLSTTITSINSLNLTLTAAPGNSGGPVAIELDNAPNIIAARNQASPTGVGGLPVYFPATATNLVYPVNSFLDLSGFRTSLIINGTLQLNDTMLLPAYSKIIGYQGTAVTASSFPWDSLPEISIGAAYPGIHVINGTPFRMEGVSLQAVNGGGNNALLVVQDFGGANPGSFYKKDEFVTGGGNDNMGIGLLIRGLPGQLSASVTLEEVNFVPGGANTQGSSATPTLLCADCGSFINKGFNSTHRGAYLGMDVSGFGFRSDSSYFQGSVTPAFSFASADGNSSPPATAQVVFSGQSTMDSVGNPLLWFAAGSNQFTELFLEHEGLTAVGTNNINGAHPQLVWGRPPGFGSGSTTDMIGALNTCTDDGVFVIPGNSCANMATLYSAAAIATLPSYTIFADQLPIAAPTATLASGGSLSIGSHFYQIAPIWLNGGVGRISGGSNSITTSTGNQSITLNWTDVPGGCLGYLVLRDGGIISVAGGYVHGCNTSTFTDTGLAGGGTQPGIAGGSCTMLMPNAQGIESCGPVYAPSLSLYNANSNVANILTSPFTVVARNFVLPDASGPGPGSTATFCLVDVNCVPLVTQVINDTFVRANNPIATNAPVIWTTETGTLNISSNGVVGASSGAHSFANVTTPAFSNDQYCQVTATTGSAFCTIRGSTGALTWYGCNTNVGSNAYIGKMVAGTFTTLSVGPIVAAANDVIRCEVQGATAPYTIRLYDNGVYSTSVTDSSIASGDPGIDIFSNVGDKVTNFIAGNLNVPVTGPSVVASGPIFSNLWAPSLNLCTDTTGKAVTTGCAGNISGMTSGQVPIAGSASTITSSKPLQGTDANVLSSGTVTGTAATLCTDANGGATTTGCTGGSISGLSTGQVPIAGSASSLTSSKALQGTDANILTSSTIAAGAGNLLCTDTGSGATTSGCAVFNTQSAATNTNIAATNMVASTSALHSYLFQWTISLTAVGVGCTSSTTINMNAIFTDPNVSTTTTELLGQITIAAGGNGTLGFVAQGTDNILAKTTTAVQYSTTGYTAGTGCTTNPTYQVTPTLVQLW